MGAMEMEKDRKVTEQRVTRKVIRRRRSDEKGPASTEDKKEEQTAQNVEASPKPQETVSTSPEPKVEKKKKTVSKPVSRPTLKKVEPTEIEIPKLQVTKEAPKKQSADVEKKPSQESGYSRIKVVPSAASGTDAKKTVVQPASKARGDKKEESADSKSRFVRKEIIEIRDFNRGKGRSSRKKRLPPGKVGKKTEITVPKAAKRVIRISESISVGELARKMSVKVNELISRLMSMGMMVTINQVIDLDTSTLVASEFGYEIENVALVAEDLLEKHEKEIVSNQEDISSRPPIVTVMGHVDHGKTTLLDRIRKADVVSGEAGGITQHIGAYTVQTSDGKYLTFIDTPGHKAFTSMRARGAQVTDFVILVVAADDGIMPQTREAISHAQSAKVPIIVAINKMDIPDANPDQIKNELTEFNMVPEEWGGDTIFVPVSAKTGEGVPKLLEYLNLQAEILELKANSKRPAKGVVLESCLDKQRGVTTTILVQDGTLKEGDTVVAGVHSGRVRAMKDDKGSRVREAGPSYAVELMGLSGVATAGDPFSVVTDEKKAKQIAELKYNQVRQKELAKTSRVSLDDLYSKIEAGDVKELKVVIKADTAGSVEVLTKAVEELSTAKVSVKVIHGAVGGVSENDVMLASASGALVVSFHVRPDAAVRRLAEKHDIEIRFYDVIYELTEDVTKAMAGLLQPKQVEKVTGHAEIREVYNIPKIGVVAGCFMKDGKIQRSSQVRLVRDNVPIYTGNLKSLKRFKDDVREVTEGLECGMSIENYNDVKVGDIIEAFLIEEVEASLH